MTTKEIKSLLQPKVRSIVNEIFPQAKIKGKRAMVGDLRGNPGDSLVIELDGNDAGVWADFATGDRGDIFELLSKSRFGGFKETMEYVRGLLNIPDVADGIAQFQSTERKFAKPIKDWQELEETDEIVSYFEGRGISYRELVAAKVRRNRDGSAYVFLYWDESKELCLAKYICLKRDGGKKREWVSKDGKPVLFGMHLPIPKQHTDNLRVVICEGEVDALSFRQAGVFAVSVPFGATNHQWLHYCSKWLSNFTDIIICFDGDDKGVQGRNNLLSLINGRRCRVVDFPSGEDANSYLCKKGAKALKSLLDGAKEHRPERVATVTELQERVISFAQAGPPELNGVDFMGWTGHSSVNWKLRPAEFTIWTGFPGHGKSEMIYQLCAHLLCYTDSTIAIASLEVKAEQFIYQIACSACAKVLNLRHSNPDISGFHSKLLRKFIEFCGERLIVYDFVGTASIDEVIKFCEYSCLAKGADHVFIDSIAKTNLNIEDYAASKEFMNRATGSMAATGAHYHFVAHSRKGDSKDIRSIPNIDSIKGAACFGIETFNVVSMWRSVTKGEYIKQCLHRGDREKANDIETSWSDGKLCISKQKIGGDIGEYDLWFNKDNNRFRRDRNEDDSPFFDLSGPRTSKEF